MSEAVYEGLAWLYKMLITFVVAVAAIAIISFAIENDTNVRDVQRDALLARILYSPDSIWASENGVLLPGVVDLTRCDTAALAGRMHYPVGYGGARIVVITTGGENLAFSTTAQCYINGETFTSLETQVKGGVRKAGTLEHHAYPVTIRTSGGTSNGMLVIDIALPEEA